VIAGQLAVGFFLSAGIGLAAYRAGSLSCGGVLGAILTGTAIFGFGGWVWGVLLVAFFVSSSVLSRWREAQKASAAERFAKGGQRDLGQALANGGAGGLIALAYAVRPDSLLFAAFVGAMAAVTADTWATEVGILNRQPPRLITTGRPVAAGTSGGVTLLGLMASLGGAAFIGVLAWLLAGSDFRIQSPEPRLLYLPPIATVAGLSASLFDSFLGATVQAMYFCDTCRQETERRVHRCGSATRRTRGWRWLDNDGVNFVSSVVGGLVAVLLAAGSGWSGR
jgi:uncharacterized protein (TIGR00297 family)